MSLPTVPTVPTVPTDPLPFGMGAVNDLARDTAWAHDAVLGFADYGIALFALLLLAGFWVARRSGSPRLVAASLWAGAATLLAVAVNQPVVHAVNERRPFTHPGLLVLAGHSPDGSFPSDHAVMAGAVAAGLWLVDRRLGAVAAVAAVLMAFARVYIAAHYPQDVAGGLVLGSGVALLGWLVLRRPLTGLVTRAESSLLRPLVHARR